MMMVGSTKRSRSLSRTRLSKSRSKDNQNHENGLSLLHINARKGDLKEVKRLLNDDHDQTIIDVNVVACNTKSKGITPLHLAAEGGHISVMKELLKHGANIDAEVKHVNNGGGGCGWTPLHYAAKERKREAVKFLVENGAFLASDINDFRHNPPLYYCVGLDWAYEEKERLVQEKMNASTSFLSSSSSSTSDSSSGSGFDSEETYYINSSSEIN
ncbi:phytochrome-interacting ankyrin-repeat protein 2-like [Cannabis sativa]|uniref:phytochrome-interacting ankyrin-repeat protein 2-like n=1 Tax=Cannabis sativa TaxID=3483 RepID=UPI0029C9C2E0|nr:phytochrome-interacting ankyrin-repeat protein 2-like [Cannabis sativa]